MGLEFGGWRFLLVGCLLCLIVAFLFWWLVGALGFGFVGLGYFGFYVFVFEMKACLVVWFCRRETYGWVVAAMGFVLAYDLWV